MWSICNYNYFGRFLRSGPHKHFQAKSLTTFDFLFNSKTAHFLTLFPLFLELPLIITSVTDCPTFASFCFGSNFEKIIFIQPGYNVKKETVSAFERKSKIANYFI